jgi:transcriptional regulator with XRE-family HTH domain
VASQGSVSELPPPLTLGTKIRAARLERGYGVRELARLLKCSASLISQIERDKANPSVNTLYSIANVLGISVDSMFAATTSEGAPSNSAEPAATRSDLAKRLSTSTTVQRQESRLAIDLDHGVRWELLTPAPEHNNEFMEVTYPVGSSSAGDDEFVRHSGREYAIVLAGDLQARIGDEMFVLQPGDSLSFDPTTPHRFWNDGPSAVRAVWFVQDRWIPSE